MNFVFRPAQLKDVDSLYKLASQFSLISLPQDKKTIEKKIELSINSFLGKTEKLQASYIFVTEDIETGLIAGTSQILSQAGTKKNPRYSFEIIKKERFSKNLGIGFIHQILRLKTVTNGPSEVGGLVVGNQFRGRPEKIGVLTSLGRFLYIGLNKHKFQKRLHAELAPSFTEDGKSEFWEALGRRFTGLPYQEADLLSQSHKEFIKSLFPEEDIYLCLLGANARLVIGQVGEQTQPALHMLKKLGFVYENEVDPFDGGPHMGILTDDLNLIKQIKSFSVSNKLGSQFSGLSFVGIYGSKDFKAILSSYRIKDDLVGLPHWAMRSLQISEGDKVYMMRASS